MRIDNAYALHIHAMDFHAMLVCKILSSVFAPNRNWLSHTWKSEDALLSEIAHNCMKNEISTRYCPQYGEQLSKIRRMEFRLMYRIINYNSNIGDFNVYIAYFLHSTKIIYFIVSLFPLLANAQAHPYSYLGYFFPRNFSWSLLTKQN